MYGQHLHLGLETTLSKPDGRSWCLNTPQNPLLWKQSAGVCNSTINNKLINSTVHGIREKLIYSAGNNFSVSIEPEV
jgi:hypothetical protein